MTRLLPLALAAALLLPATAAAKPAVCTKKSIRTTLGLAGKDAMAGIGTVECGDVTADKRKDAVFTVLSGGTAGAVRFGVIRGGAGKLLLYRKGYKLGIDRVSRRQFDVQQPVYGEDDPNCCPSSFAVTEYLWGGGRFRAGERTTATEADPRFR
jgi:hypothetical protein